MSMFARIKRIFYSFAGMFIEMAENPELILKQNLRDMQDQIPKINTGLGQMRGKLESIKELNATLTKDVGTLKNKVKACLVGEDRETAGKFAVALKSKQDDLEKAASDLATAQTAYNKMQQVKTKFMADVEEKTAEAMAAISGARAAEWKRQIAGVIQSFEVVGIDASHDEMVARLKEKENEANGMLLSAVESMETGAKEVELDKKVAAYEGEEMLKQFEIEMGLVKKPSVSQEAGLDDADKLLAEFQKKTEVKSAVAVA